MDCGKSIKGKRIFGDSKSVLGFIGMTFGTAAIAILWGMFLKMMNMEALNLIYKNYPNTIFLNLFTGTAFGFAYMVFELPNSFIKRRFDIDASNRGRFPVNIFIFIYDQIDSMIGVMLVLSLLAGLNLKEYMSAVFLGGFTHVAVNGILILFKVRKYW